MLFSCVFAIIAAPIVPDIIIFRLRLYPLFIPDSTIVGFLQISFSPIPTESAGVPSTEKH